ncbi:efflux RND transporter periplasmic adaptor subunit [Treponema sp.]|uniref:efflux RND transporter periplasmic adaptor subunit n=1 Tax=Treponema sp. TaxID=166 RepID=UPI00298DEE77|nr:efflux RND transporter periplasmic adaptor subunit [Treponema sp.]
MKKTIVITSAFVLAALSLTSCSKKGPVQKGEVEAVFAVNAYKVSPTNLDNYLEFGGDVDAASSVAVMPDTAGKISQLHVKVGQKVSKGQILAAVDASRPGMVFAASPVRAPVAGTVTYFPCVVGTSVAQSSVIAKISSTNNLEIETSVPERFVSRISMNQKAKLSFNAYPGETFDAHIIEISPVLDTASRTMSIKLAIDKKDPKIKIGMYAKIHLVTEQKKNVCVLPYGTVITRKGETFVFTVKDEGEKKVAVLTPVRVGIRVDNLQEIEAGVIPGDIVITKGQTLLSDGSSVNVLSVSEEIE